MRWFFAMVIFFFGKHFLWPHKRSLKISTELRPVFTKTFNIIFTRHMSVYSDKNITSRLFSDEPGAQVCKTRLGNIFRLRRRRFIISFERDTIDIRPSRSRSSRIQRQRFFLFTIAHSMRL